MLATKTHNKEVQEHFDQLLKVCSKTYSESDLDVIREAFIFADHAHSDMKRRSGEPFIIHPISVARIVVAELHLGVESVASALLHDVVEDTSYTLDDIEERFGGKVRQIVDGLTKIAGVIEEDISIQAENFRKILLTMIDDPRVILIKLADRLHNMRTLQSLPRNKQIKISSETIYLFAPLAHRLGLYSIKTELENLSLKYRYPKVYEELKNKIEASEKTRNYYVNNFIEPVQDKLNQAGVRYKVVRRPKSIYSIWYIMQHENIPFEEVYDLIQINIVFEPQPDVPEKSQCWQVYSIITDVYMPKPEMIRDFVTKHKANGYEALHATCMGPNGKWVDVQIKTTRMNKIAERGLESYIDLPEGLTEQHESELNRWLNRVKEVLEAPEENALEFLDDFRLNLFSAEILVFTPKGHLKTLPQDATVLDFAYEIHSEVGDKAIAAKVNHKLVPLNHQLCSGDQVEILTSDSNRISYEWLDYVKTAKARSIVKKALKSDIKSKAEKGQKMLEEKLGQMNLQLNPRVYKKIFQQYGISSKDELFGRIGSGLINMDELGKVLKKKNKSKFVRYWNLQFAKSVTRSKKGSRVQNIKEVNIENKGKGIKTNRITEGYEPVYQLAPCCKPIPGDEIMGYATQKDKVAIHKTSCPNAVKVMSNHANLIVPVKWTAQKLMSYLVRIAINGIDQFNIYNDITTIISRDLRVQIGAVNLDSHDGIIEGTLDLYVHNTQDLNNLIMNIIKIKGIENVKRVEYTDEE